MDMEDSFEFMTKIVQRKAWTPDFYATLQQQMPAEYGAIDYTTAFYKWANSFTAEFPDLVEERKETILNSEKVKLDGIQGIVDKLVEHLDPQNKAILLEWAAENVNELKLTFPNKLNLDMELLMAYDPQPIMPFGQEQTEQPAPFGNNEV
jgi:inorganic triphosphatase YgiF